MDRFCQGFDSQANLCFHALIIEATSLQEKNNRVNDGLKTFNNLLEILMLRLFYISGYTNGNGWYSLNKVHCFVFQLSLQASNFS